MTNFCLCRWCKDGSIQLLKADQPEWTARSWAARSKSIRTKNITYDSICIYDIRRPRQTQGGERQGIRQASFSRTSSKSSGSRQQDSILILYSGSNSKSNSNSNNNNNHDNNNNNDPLPGDPVGSPSHRSRTSIHWLRGFCFTGGGSFPESPRGTWGSLACPSRLDLFVRGGWRLPCFGGLEGEQQEGSMSHCRNSGIKIGRKP